MLLIERLSFPLLKSGDCFFFQLFNLVYWAIQITHTRLYNVKIQRGGGGDLLLILHW